MYVLSGGYSYPLTSASEEKTRGVPELRSLVTYERKRGDRSRDLGIRCTLVSGGMAGVEISFLLRLRPLSAVWKLRLYGKPVSREVETLTCLALDACCVSVEC